MTRASPSTGHGENLPSSDAYLRALALELQMKERKKALNEAHKRVRTTIEGAGIVLEDLDTLVKMKDKSPEESEAWIRRKFAALSSYFSDLRNLELFTPRDHSAKREVYRHKGRMAGVEGLEASPPKGITTDEVTEWMTGWHEGSCAREGSKPVLADILADALKTADAGGVVNGTGKGADQPGLSKRARARAAGEMVREQPEADEDDDGPAGDSGGEEAAARLAAAGMGGDA